MEGSWGRELEAARAPRSAAEAQRHRDEYVTEIVDRGSKLGIKLKRGQAVEKLAFRAAKGEVILSEDDEVSRELQEVFGAETDETWVGFARPPGPARARPISPEPTQLVYRFTLVVRPVRTEPQVVPVVSTYRDVSFREHYLLNVLVLCTQPRPVETTVRAVFTARRGGRSPR